MSETQTAAVEAVLEPERRIIDPHHHMWLGGPLGRYMLEDLRADTDGHNVVATVFVECISGYRTEGPEHMKVVGETEFMLPIARASADGKGPRIAALAGRADLTLGAEVDEVLEAHLALAGDLFRSIRHVVAWDASPDIRRSHTRPPPSLMADAKFREGFARLAKFGLTFEAWLYHTQIAELTDLARAFPDTKIVMNHFGGPLGVGPYAGKREEIFAAWKRDTAELAKCPNVFVKIGGMAMHINGYDWANPGNVPSSEEFARVQGDWYRAAIDIFGPSRAMFESNFPMDKASLPYRTLWNGYKRVAAPYSEAEKDALFWGAAKAFYRLDV